MRQISRQVTIGVVAALGLACVRQRAFADQTERLTIALSVRDTAQVPYDILTQAQTEVTRIFR